MDVDKKSAAGTVRHQGQIYSFCSQGCLEKFRADPSRFVNTGSSASPAVSHVEPVIQATRPARTEYVCPMHPQIVRSEPGTCPICGMALEPRTVTTTPEENAELRDMTRRFWVSTALSLPVLFLAMSDLAAGQPLPRTLGMHVIQW